MQKLFSHLSVSAVILYCLSLSALNMQAMFRCKWRVFAINLFRKRLKLANDIAMRFVGQEMCGSCFQICQHSQYYCTVCFFPLWTCKRLAFAISLVRKRLRFAIKAFRNGWLRYKVLLVLEACVQQVDTRHAVGVLLPVIRFSTQVRLEECTVLSASMRAEGEVVRNAWQFRRGAITTFTPLRGGY